MNINPINYQSNVLSNSSYLSTNKNNNRNNHATSFKAKTDTYKFLKKFCEIPTFLFLGVGFLIGSLINGLQSNKTESSVTDTLITTTPYKAKVDTTSQELIKENSVKELEFSSHSATY